MKGTIANIENSIKEILSKLGEYCRHQFEGKEMYQIKILIPRIFVAKLIGAKGCMIQEIASCSGGAVIKILADKKESKRISTSQEEDTVVAVIGSQSVVSEALEKIIEQIEYYKNGGPVLASGSAIFKSIPEQFRNSILIKKGLLVKMGGENQLDDVYNSIGLNSNAMNMMNIQNLNMNPLNNFNQRQDRLDKNFSFKRGSPIKKDRERTRSYSNERRRLNSNERKRPRDDRPERGARGGGFRQQRDIPREIREPKDHRDIRERDIIRRDDYVVEPKDSEKNYRMYRDKSNSHEKAFLRDRDQRDRDIHFYPRERDTREPREYRDPREHHRGDPRDFREIRDHPRDHHRDQRDHRDHPRDTRDQRDQRDIREPREKDYGRDSREKRKDPKEIKMEKRDKNTKNPEHNITYEENGKFKITTNILVPDYLVSLLIGRNGDTIKGLMHRSNCTISFAKEVTFYFSILLMLKFILIMF